MIDKTRAVILLGHGSRVESANAPLTTVAEWCVERMEGVRLEPAFLQLAKPGIEETVQTLVADGINHITLVPFFLYRGAHVREDIPELVAKLQSEYPQLEIDLAEHLGVHPMMADIVAERVGKVDLIMTEENAKGGLKGRWGYELGPEEIEGESFRLISGLADLEQLTPAEVALVKRVIHATGDPLFSELVMWSPDAVAKGVEAIKGGATIFTDVEMVRAGVSKVRATSFGCKVECRLNDPEVVSEAREREMTRSAVAIERAVRQDPEAIFAFGNAPTALFRLLELIDEGVAKPKLIIGVVVGFVGAAESKDELMQRSDVNWISCKGNKGGSNVAAASVNALFKGAAGEV